MDDSEKLVAFKFSNRTPRNQSSQSSERVSPSTIPTRASGLYDTPKVSDHPRKVDRRWRPKMIDGRVLEGVSQYHYSDPIVPTTQRHMSQSKSGTSSTHDSVQIGSNSINSHPGSYPTTTPLVSSQVKNVPFSKPRRPKIKWSWSQPLPRRREAQPSSSFPDETSSIKSYFRWSSPTAHFPSPIIPMRPPERLLPATFVPEAENRVTVEHSFDEVPTPTIQKDIVRQKSLSRSLHPSIDPKKIFSAPLHALRTLSRERNSGHLNTPLNNTHLVISSADALDHRSLLKRQQTGAVLNRVSTLLESIRSSKTKPAIARNMFKRPKSVNDTKRVDSAQTTSSTIAGSKSNGNFNRSRNDISGVGSLSSSILRLKMGDSPKTTPKEGATYKIKKSPSAETEEYFKIDISVRGETSYLPSEARRIHTPPLPEDGSKQFRRGFFFDYNSPQKYSSSFVEATSTNQTPQTAQDSDHGKVKPGFLSSDTHPTDESHQKDKSKKIRSRRSMSTKRRTGDWYDTQLANLDNIELNDESKVNPIALGPISAGIGVDSESEQRKHKDTLDYSIPEHLPSSPLCPRSPKYWRVVEHRGSQFRGCWMHGYGLYEQNETTK